MLWYVQSAFRWRNPLPDNYWFEEVRLTQPGYEVLDLFPMDIIRTDGEVPEDVVVHLYPVHLYPVVPHRSPTHALCRHRHMRRL